MDTSMKRRNLLAAFICMFSYSILVLAKSSCNVVTYGTPLAKDCFDLSLQLPGGETSPTINIDTLRSFVEPKFLQPGFAPVHDPFKTEMVQLPKIWKKGPYLTQTSYFNENEHVPETAESMIGTCCLALLSIATSSGVVQQATSVDRWRTVQNAFIDIVQDCLVQGKGKDSGGMLFANSMHATLYSKPQCYNLGLTLLSVIKPDAKVVYVYARGSPFEGSVNRYMSSYKQGLNPYNPNAILLDPAPANSSISEGVATS